MAEKLVSMTAAEINRVYGKDMDKIMAMARAAPEYKGDLNPGGKPIARGFAEFQEYLKRKDHEKAETRKARISIRLPEETVASLREVSGYGAILSEYIMRGIASGSLKLPAPRKYGHK